MSEPAPNDPAATPEFRAAQRWNIVWVVPLVALLLGVWLLYRNLAAQGPVAEVSFETADGIFADKTEVRCRSVRVGVVRDVKLSDDLKSVRVFLELDSDAGHLLRRGTQFWVVKPRFSVTEVSGVGTLITGAYIEMDPGSPDAARETHFTGLETPATTSRSVPGRRVTLSADEAASLAEGAPVYFRGFEVGRIESRALAEAGRKVSYEAFIKEEYSELVTDNSRFWNTSGVDISAGAEGFKLRTPSLQAMVSGGVSFGLPPGSEPGRPVADGAVFTLYRDRDAALQSTFNPTLKFVLLFDQTVRGLAEKAPVEFRGITIGRVAEISFELLPAPDDKRIPVLIEIDPALMRPESPEAQVAPGLEFVRAAVAKGLRAALKTGNLITGSLFVDLDYYPESIPADMGKTGDYATIPTVSSGFAQLEAKLTAILDKLQALPLEQTLTNLSAAAAEAKTTIADARGTLEEIQATAAAARATLENPRFTGLPDDLRQTLEALQKSVASVGPDGAVQGDLLRTLDELRASLRALKGLTTTLEEKPNSLIFGRGSSGNPQPKAPRGNH